MHHYACAGIFQCWACYINAHCVRSTPPLCRLFRGRYRPAFTFRARRHNRPLHTHIEGVRYLPGLYQRSLFNMANIYNMLPQAFVDMDSVAGLQSKLTAVVRDKCRQDRANWRSFLSAREYNWERIRDNQVFSLV